jgi:hypothetical protein
LYGQSLSNFIDFDADYIEIPISCVWHLSACHAEYSSLTPMSSTFSSISTFLVGFVSKSDPVDLTLLISLWMTVLLGTVTP